MLEVVQTEEFEEWFAGIRDSRAQAKIAIRIDRLSMGNPGNVKAVGQGVSELKIDYGPGYRVYFIRRGQQLVVLLAGGDKSTQQKDIARAMQLANDL